MKTRALRLGTAGIAAFCTLALVSPSAQALQADATSIEAAVTGKTTTVKLEISKPQCDADALNRITVKEAGKYQVKLGIKVKFSMNDSERWEPHRPELVPPAGLACRAEHTLLTGISPRKAHPYVCEGALSAEDFEALRLSKLQFTFTNKYTNAYGTQVNERFHLSYPPVKLPESSNYTVKINGEDAASGSAKDISLNRKLAAGDEVEVFAEGKRLDAYTVGEADVCPPPAPKPEPTDTATPTPDEPETLEPEPEPDPEPGSNPQTPPSPNPTGPSAPVPSEETENTPEPVPNPEPEPNPAPEPAPNPGPEPAPNPEGTPNPLPTTPGTPDSDSPVTPGTGDNTPPGFFWLPPVAGVSTEPGSTTETNPGKPPVAGVNETPQTKQPPLPVEAPVPLPPVAGVNTTPTQPVVPNTVKTPTVVKEELAQTGTSSQLLSALALFLLAAGGWLKLRSRSFENS